MLLNGRKNNLEAKIAKKSDIIRVGRKKMGKIEQNKKQKVSRHKNWSFLRQFLKHSKTTKIGISGAVFELPLMPF